ncbi:SH3 domain-containing protein [Chitinophaga sp. Mgbs1]|uniref:SH3 domain-containing protein n=1 Tax=Chitinophaga solisilvae TaxID=1233460 RepID=A0A9Q5DB28_9BACT|nr:SH3 domain-containing protein [Chitinophaga solisilvae]
MRYSFMVLLLFLTCSARAQFAIVADKDGFTNIRSKPGISRQITGKVLNNDIIYCYESEGEWCYVDYYSEGEIQTGYIHQSRIRKIDQLPQLQAVKPAAADKYIFRHDSIQVSLTTGKFIPENPSQATENYYKSINRKPIWGTDGNVPRRQYKGLEVKWKMQQTAVPDSSLKGLFEPDPERTVIYYDAPQQRLFITATNSDGAGSYEVLWWFDKGVFQRRAVFHGF